MTIQAKTFENGARNTDNTVVELNRAVAISRALTWSGVQSGCRDSRSAAAPETIGADSEVPDSKA